MPLAATPIYASILAIVYFILSIRVIGFRRSAGISLGDAGDKLLLRRMRVHSNFAEYAPFVLLLMALAELNGAAALHLHVLGQLLLAGRLSHAIGMGRQPSISVMRVAGMALTFAALLSSSILNLTLVLTSS